MWMLIDSPPPSHSVKIQRLDMKHTQCVGWRLWSWVSARVYSRVFKFFRLRQVCFSTHLTIFQSLWAKPCGVGLPYTFFERQKWRQFLYCTSYFAVSVGRSLCHVAWRSKHRMFLCFKHLKREFLELAGGWGSVCFCVSCDHLLFYSDCYVVPHRHSIPRAAYARSQTLRESQYVKWIT